MNKKIAATLLVMLCPSIANAAGVYMGASLNQSKVDDYEDYVINSYDDGSIVAADFDETGTGGRLFIGNEVTPNFSFEFGYQTTGDAKTDAVSDGSGIYAAGDVSHTLNASGFDVSALGKLPLGTSGSVFLRLGMFVWKGEEEIADSTGSITFDDDGNDPFYGLGGEFKINNQIGLRGEYTFYKYEIQGDDFDVSSLSLSVAYYFEAK